MLHYVDWTVKPGSGIGSLTNDTRRSLTQAFFARAAGARSERWSDPRERDGSGRILLACDEALSSRTNGTSPGPKRGGGVLITSFDGDPVHPGTADEMTPTHFERGAGHDAARNRGEPPAGNTREGKANCRHRSVVEHARSHRGTGQKAGRHEGAVKSAVHRLRQRPPTQTVPHTVAGPDEVEEELRHLHRRGEEKIDYGH